MVALNVDGVWARAFVENIIQENEELSYICWLPDYGIMRIANHVFKLPDCLKPCPAIAKQASLYKVVNLTTVIEKTLKF